MAQVELKLVAVLERLTGELVSGLSLGDHLVQALFWIGLLVR